METNPLLAKAINLAMQAHAGQTDKAGMPYIGHVMRVMQAGRTIDEKIAGVLHDIVEDTTRHNHRLQCSQMLASESDTKEDSDVIVMCYGCPIVVPKFAG